MRLEFNDNQKAEIFVRDRAICAFSGKSLWILDYGVSPTYEIDWVDHIRPAARGGDNSIDNGICASYFHNVKKRDNANDNKFMFRNGKPTNHFFYFHETVPTSIADHLSRFAKVQAADWYLNRTLFRFLLGIDRIFKRDTGKVLKRDEHYYAKSTLKILKKWKRLSAESATIHDRGLVSQDLSDDQLALLNLLQLNNEEQIVTHMQYCHPWYANACNAIHLLAQAETSEDLRSITTQIDFDKLPARVALMMEKNCDVLSSVYATRI